MTDLEAFNTLSTRARALEASKVREVAEAGMKLGDVIPLWFGEGAWPTDAVIVDTAVRSLQAGEHFYQANNGIVSLRDEISRYTEGLFDRPITRERVTVTNSGLQALVLTADLLASPGDRIVATGPVWPNITGAFSGRGADVHVVSLQPSNGRWAIDLDELIDALTPETKAVIINSPHNPTGWTMTPDQQQQVLDNCRKYGIWVVADDVYARLYRHGRSAPSFLSLAEPEDKLISVNSFSKAWSMTGWRLGWLIHPAVLEEKYGQLTEFNSSCSPAFIQEAGAAAIRNSDTVIANLTEKLETGYALTAERLRGFSRVDFVEPDGAFYVFFKVRGMEDSTAAALNIMNKTRVGLAPGVAFGPEGEGYLRLCYARPAEVLEEAFNRLESFLKG